jgi:hypothetical protein
VINMPFGKQKPARRGQPDHCHHHVAPDVVSSMIGDVDLIGMPISASSSVALA